MPRDHSALKEIMGKMQGIRRRASPSWAPFLPPVLTEVAPALAAASILTGWSLWLACLISAVRPRSHTTEGRLKGTIWGSRCSMIHLPILLQNSRG